MRATKTFGVFFVASDIYIRIGGSEFDKIYISVSTSERNLKNSFVSTPWGKYNQDDLVHSFKQF